MGWPGPEGWAVIFGISSAASWGAADFSGGLAARTTRVYAVVFLSQLVGGAVLLAAALALAHAPPDLGRMAWGAGAGLCGVLGLAALYQALAHGRMGVAAPVSALAAALLPLSFSWFSEGLPRPTQAAGFVLALAAVWLLTTDKTRGGVRINEIVLPLAAGIGFGLFFVLIDQVSSRAVLWPLVGARASSIVLMGAFLLAAGRAPAPGRPNPGAIILAGLLDAGGNVFFALAAAGGRLDVSAVLASLYPAGTVILAWVILKERLGGRQLIGVACALAALALIS
jgi:drug/metabolite transporter (DMT)-like permease